MTKEEKIDKINRVFSLLSEEKQDYILGVIQALAYAHDMANQQDEAVLSDLEQTIESE
jgi:hypothetical protein